MKIDPYNHKEKYFAWKEKVQKSGIKKISETNSKMVLDYIFDMEHGLNIGNGTKKGARSYPRLNNLRQRLIFIIKKLEEIYDVKDARKLTERNLFFLFNSMRNGEIRTNQGKIYKSVADYAHVAKAFWHWWMKVNRKEGIDIIDITTDIDVSTEKPKWVYLTEEQIRELAENAKYNYKILIWFLFDSGIRAPSELVNIKISDLHDDFKELNIRDEISKTFGRKIKLMLSSKLLKEYVQFKKLSSDDYLFPISPPSVNKYLKRLAKRIFGEEVSLAGEKYSNLTMYDFRHCSCCYWLNRYKSESALKFRFGWKKSDKIHYYSEFLGMKDNISEEDMLIDVTKTEIEQKLIKSEQKYEILLEKFLRIENQMKEIDSRTEEIVASALRKGMNG